MTTAVTVAGVAVVTMVVESDSAIDGVPTEVDPLEVTEKPADPVTSAPDKVACAMARSAPFEVPEAGVSLVVTTPLASLSADVGVKVPNPVPAVVNLTTCPARGVPFASRTVAVNVAGVAAVTEAVDSATVMDGAPVVTVPVLGVT